MPPKNPLAELKPTPAEVEKFKEIMAKIKAGTTSPWITEASAKELYNQLQVLLTNYGGRTNG
jgi:hypothetical protein